VTTPSTRIAPEPLGRFSAAHPPDPFPAALYFALRVRGGSLLSPSRAVPLNSVCADPPCQADGDVTESLPSRLSPPRVRRVHDPIITGVMAHGERGEGYEGAPNG
jgi:hypothetical protein